MLVIQHPTSLAHHPFSKTHLGTSFFPSSFFLIPQLLGEDSDLTRDLCASKCQKSQPSQDLTVKDKKDEDTSSESKGSSTSGTHQAQESLIYSDHKTKAYETNSSYRFVFDLPGVKENDVELEVEGNLLRLKAKREKSGAKDSTSSASTILRSYNESYRIRRAHWDASDVTSVMQDGVLTVTIRKSETMKPFHVQVHAHEPEASLLDGNKKNNGLLLTLDVPGVKAADASVEYKNGFLHVQYKRHLKEFSRAFAVDESSVHLSHLQAFLTDGVLTITSPSRPSKRVKLTSTSKSQESAKPHELTEAPADKTSAETIIDASKSQDIQEPKENEIVPETVSNE